MGIEAEIRDWGVVISDKFLNGKELGGGYGIVTRYLRNTLVGWANVRGVLGEC